MHRVLYNEGAQTATFVPRDALYRVVAPAAATYEILDLREDETSTARVLVAAAAATIDSLSDTTSAATGPSSGTPYTVPVADASLYTIGHTYRIQDADGLGEPFTVAAIDTGASERVVTLSPLQRDYATSATIVGVELSCSIPAAITDDDDYLESDAGPYAIIWRYTIDSIDYVLPEQFFLSRYSFRPPATEADVLLAAPTLADRVRNRASIHSALVVATDDYLGDLEAIHIDPRLSLAGREAKRAVVAKALEYAYMWLKDDGSMQLSEFWGNKYAKIIGQISLGRRPMDAVKVDNETAEAPQGNDTRRRGLFAIS